MEEVTQETLRRDIDLKVSQILLAVFIAAGASLVCTVELCGFTGVTVETFGTCRLIGGGLFRGRPLPSLGLPITPSRILWYKNFGQASRRALTLDKEGR